MKALITLAKKIITKNPNCLISGSFGLRLQGFNLRREPQDLDIFLPFGNRFVKIEKMLCVSDSDQYPEGTQERTTYATIDKTKVDVMKPRNKIEHEFAIIEGLPVIHFLEIINYKMSHALDTHFSKYKHTDDIIHILINNRK